MSREVAILPLSLYTLGMAIGPLFYAPLSELYGRRGIYFISMVFFLAFTAGAGASNDIQTLCICRILAGTLGTAPLAIGAGSLADVWDTTTEGAPAAMLFVLAPFLGPTLGK